MNSFFHQYLQGGYFQKLYSVYIHISETEETEVHRDGSKITFFFHLHFALSLALM